MIDKSTLLAKVLKSHIAIFFIYLQVYYDLDALQKSFFASQRLNSQTDFFFFLRSLTNIRQNRFGIESLAFWVVNNRAFFLNAAKPKCTLGY